MFDELKEVKQQIQESYNVKYFKVTKRLKSLPKAEAFLEPPIDTGRKLNVHKTFRRCPGRLPNVLYTFNLRPVSTGAS